MGVLLALGVALTPTLALLHSHHRPHAHADHAAGTGHTPHDSDGNTRHGDPTPRDGDQGDCGLCDLVHQARADPCTTLPTPPAPARTGYIFHTPPDCPPRSRTALSDAPPRGPPAL